MKFTELYDFFAKSIHFQTYIGALIGHMLSIYDNEFKGTLPFLQRILPDKKTVFYDRLNLVLMPLIGMLLACGLLDPSNFKSALFAGLSWSGTITAILQRTNKSLNN